MIIIQKISKRYLLLICLWSGGQLTFAQTSADIQAKESKYYKIVDVPIPGDVVLEVGGLALTDNDQLGVSTRRGEVWLIDKPYGSRPVYRKFAHGLHEALGLGYKDKGFYLAQRGELTRLEDNDGDGKADLYKTIYAWPLSGNYHDYSYGPKFMANGDMLVTLNLGWIGYGASLVKWRGWMLKITPEGDMTPIATGLRSPAGFGVNDQGDIFYTENQGDWVGSGRMTHLESGDFAGNPAGLRWTDDPKSPLTLKPEEIEEESGLSLYEYAKQIPALKTPAIWFPHTILGISTSDILIDNNAGKFGPFEGQMLIGDQGHSKIMRVFMEKVNGVYQGAAFPFREGFSSGILRMIWGSDASMFVGMTSRGWASTGKEVYGLQRLVWTGKTPFEIKTIKALSDGFALEFTKPVNREAAGKPSSYKLATFTYHYHNTYGSPIVDQQKAMVHKAEVSEDGLSVKLTIHGMRLGFIHQLKIFGVKSRTGESLLHDTGYYTLNEVPGGVLKSPQLAGASNSGKNLKQPKRVTEIPATWMDGPDKKLVVGTKPGLKFDVTELEVERNSRVEITFNNNDDMLHNLVIVQPGPDSPDKVGEMAVALGLEGPDLNYVPDTDLVLFHTGILQPETTEKIYFQVPKRRGEYWIVCTFPGHSYTMRAKLIVK
ncbi:sulfocyanin-like copper-binding protein [Fulvivirgaceae bacterium BMA12]|uniref:Sulfocyanin-like copper-binding protein n=1 Tax=Agaribacillus aureus TaxID=3051825 RepID=A0ABT8LH17_9BACT|nr:sulfocyanin-like copper-binding protein [Fulvivirgaceae bacterium BMA12]